jgi:hypothetical protein
MNLNTYLYQITATKDEVDTMVRGLSYYHDQLSTMENVLLQKLVPNPLKERNEVHDILDVLEDIER